MYRVYADDHLLYSSEVPDREYHLLNPKIKQDAGKVHTFTFTILPSHPEYDSIAQMSTVVKVYEDETLIFRGRVLDINKGMWLDKKCTCEDALGYLNDSWIDKLAETQETITAFFMRCINAHNDHCSAGRQLYIGDITIPDRNVVRKFKIDSISNVMNVLSNTLIKEFGGYLRIRYTEERNYIDYIEKYDHTCSQTVEFGQNLIDLTEQQKGSNMFSILIPTGKSYLKIDEECQTTEKTLPNGVVVRTISGLPYIIIPEAVTKYGQIYRTENFSSITTVPELIAKGEKFIETNYRKYPHKITVKLIDLKFLGVDVDQIKIGDTVRIVSEPHEIDHEYVLQTVEIDIQNPDKTSYTFGDSDQNGGAGATGSGSISSTTSIEKKTIQQIITDSKIKDAKIEILDSELEITNTTVTIQGGKISANETAIELANSNISIQGGRIDAVELEVLNIDSDLVEINAKTTAIDTDILDIKSNITYIDTELLNIDAELVDITGDLTVHEAELVDIDTRILDISSDVTTIDSRITTINGQITTINSNITTINGHVTNLNSDVTNINSDITNINGTLNAYDARIDTIEASYITASEIDSDFITSRITSSSVINAGTVYASNLSCGYFCNQDPYGIIKSAEIIDNGDGTYELMVTTVGNAVRHYPFERGGGEPESYRLNYQSAPYTYHVRVKVGDSWYESGNLSATNAYDNGWSGAYGTVGISPTSQQDLGYGGSVTVYAQAKAASGAPSKTNVASVKITAPADRYETGWSGCYGTVGISPSTQQDLGYGGSVTVYAQAKRSSSATSKTNVSSVKITAPADRYGTGWAAAYAKMALPAAGTGATATVKYPASTVDQQTSQGFTVSADNTYAYIKMGSTTVARASHSAYSNGANSVTLSAGGWSGGANIVTASNGQTATITIPAISSCALVGVSSGTTYNINVTLGGTTKASTVNCSSPYNTGYDTGYNAGWNACIDACTKGSYYGYYNLYKGNYPSAPPAGWGYWWKMSSKVDLYQIPAKK